MIDQLFCFFFCAKVISHQVTYQQPYVAKTEEIQEEDEPDDRKPQKGVTIYQRNADQGRQRQQQGPTQANEQIQQEICRVFKDNCQEAIKVAVCESGLRPTAVSNTQDFGIFQIHLPAHASKIPVVDKVAYLFDPASNINLAYIIWFQQGWNPWYSSRHCWSV